MLFAGALLLYVLFLLFPATMDLIYSSTIYRYVSQALSSAVALLPFSLAEFCIYSLVLIVLYVLIKALVLLVKASPRQRDFWRRTGRRTLTAVLYLCSLFLFSCGLNYHRLPLHRHLGYTLQEEPFEQFYAMSEALLRQVNRLSLELPHNADSTTRMRHSFDSTKSMVLEAYRNLARHTLPCIGGNYPSIKPVFASRALSYSNIMGFFFPFTMEANINTDVCDCWFPALMAHEQAHLRGFMREDEANFFVFLIADHSADPEIRYSCLLHCLTYVYKSLYKARPEKAAALRASMNAHVVADLKKNRDYWQAVRSPWGYFSSKLNHLYLKANLQKEGIQSYGRVVDLLLARYRLYEQENLPLKQ